jgi:hypothetical protein
MAFFFKVGDYVYITNCNELTLVGCVNYCSDMELETLGVRHMTLDDQIAQCN